MSPGLAFSVCASLCGLEPSPPNLNDNSTSTPSTLLAALDRGTWWQEALGESSICIDGLRLKLKVCTFKALSLSFSFSALLTSFFSSIRVHTIGASSHTISPASTASSFQISRLSGRSSGFIPSCPCKFDHISLDELYWAQYSAEHLIY
ncbi:LOW QUALITY PROTEIN: hypothetical protein CVT26_014461 [Gymnopilus dilepis]|uniref:Uncharacterized protein n=1 Tax=Gymnopilus dilepis TaxID=231916 RepID=A0A409VV97_9AGAR|nr:LOW QUALITY PROTEIN: hypothetical protein CVT26_014461 [Gymnopilus dilepis]